MNDVVLVEIDVLHSHLARASFVQPETGSTVGKTMRGIVETTVIEDIPLRSRAATRNGVLLLRHQRLGDDIIIVGNTVAATSSW